MKDSYNLLLLAGLCALALLRFVFAVCVGLTVMQIAPSERDPIDLLVAIAAGVAFLIGGWLLIKIAVALFARPNP